MNINVSAWSIRSPVPSILLFVMLTVAGVIGFRAMKIQQFPDIDLPTISVTASLPGTAPAQMETEVARKIENSLATVQGLKHLYTKVQDGSALITAEFRLEKPTQEALDDVRDAVSRVRSDLPADLRDPVVQKMDLAGTPILTHNGAGETTTSATLASIVAEASHLARRGTARWSRQRRMSAPCRGWASSQASSCGQPLPPAQAATSRNGTVGSTGSSTPTSPSTTQASASVRQKAKRAMRDIIRRW